MAMDRPTAEAVLARARASSAAPDLIQLAELGADTLGATEAFARLDSAAFERGACALATICQTEDRFRTMRAVIFDPPVRILILDAKP